MILDAYGRPIRSPEPEVVPPPPVPDEGPVMVGIPEEIQRAVLAMNRKQRRAWVAKFTKTHSLPAAFLAAGVSMPES